MSNMIDERVVEMRFDNSHFENNVSTTMSTLDKLKQKLNLSGATKGLEDVNTAAKNVNMSGLGNAVETVSAKFSALQVMGVTALANITNSAVNAGKNIVKSLTIDPVKTGFSEYELKMGSIQTIMAGTGESLDTVNKYLNELNKYSDDTIYSFKDMTANIGKFTNAGVKLEDAVLAIKGISNEAALSGANANEASRAMYNFSQALSSGFVKLIDWKSIELANMATKDFKEQLIQTAVEVGTLKKGADGMYDVTKVISKANATSLNATKNFNDSLGNQWMTTEVLIETLRKYADETSEIGAKATAAATEVKTFTMMMDTLKEAAQSGWAQTWELLVGDFEEAKAFFTELSGMFGEILGESADRRNDLLSGALTSNWDKLIDKIGEAGIGLDKFEESIRNATGADKFDGIIEEFGSLDKAVKEGAISSDILKKALDNVAGTNADDKIYSFVDGLKEIERTLRHGSVGEDVKKLQTALDELGYDLGEPGVDGIIGPITKKAIEAFQEANGLIVDGIAGPKTLAALEKAGEKIGNVTDGVEDLKSTCDSLIDVITKPSGRELLLESLMNVIKAIQRPLSAVGEALRNTFAITPDGLYNALKSLNSFTKKLVPKGVLDAKTWTTLIDKVNQLGISTTEFELKIKDVLVSHGVDVDALIEKYGTLGEAFEDGAISFDDIKEALLGFKGISESLIEGGETVDKIRRSFEGLFAIFDVIATVLAGPLKLAFRVITDVLSRLGLSILDVTAGIGDTIVKFRDNLDKVVNAITTLIVDNVAEWIKQFKETEFFKTVSGWFKDASDKITDAFDNIEGRIENFNMSGVVNRLKSFGKFLSDIASAIGNSAVFTTLVDGIRSAFGKLKEFFGKFKLPEFNLDNLKTWFTDLVKIGEKVKGVDAGGISGAVTGFGKHLKDNVISWNWTVFKETALEKFVNFWLKTGDLVKKAFEKCKEAAQAIKEFLFGTQDVNLPVIMDAVTKFLWIITLIQAIKLMDTIVSPFDNISNALNNFATSLKWDAISGAFKSLALALGVFTICIVVLTSMNLKDAWSAAGILIALMVVMGIIVTIMGLVASKVDGGLNAAGAAMSLLMLVGSIAILVYTLKEIDNLNLNNTGKTFLILAGILVALTAGVRMISKAGGSSFRSVAAILTLMAALKMILDVIEAYDQFDWTGKSKAITKMTEMMLALALSVRIMSGGVKAGASASGIAFAILAMVISLKIILSAISDIADMPVDDLQKGIFVITVLLGIMTAMMAVANLTDQGYVLEKGQKSINHYTGFALALLAVVAAIWLLGKMDINTLKQGGLAVAGIIALFTGMLFVVGKSCSGLTTAPIVAMLIGMAVIIAEVAIIIKLMEDVPWQSSLSTAGALIAVLLAMSWALQSLTKYDVSSGNIYKWVGALAVLSLVVLELGLVLYAIDQMHIGDVIPEVLAISLLMGVLTGVMSACAAMGKIANESTGGLWAAVGAIAVLGVIVLELGLVLWAISAMKIGDVTYEVVALSALLVVLTGVMAACAGLGVVVAASSATGGLWAAIGAIAVLGVIVLELGLVLWAISAMKIGDMMSEVKALSVLLFSLTAVLAVLTVLGFAAIPAVLGVSALIHMITSLGTLILAVGAIMSIPYLDGFLDKGIDVLKRFATGLGEIISNFGEGLTSKLPEIGKNLRGFIDNLSPFVSGMRSVDNDLITRVRTLADAILVLAAGDFIRAISAWYGGDLATLGTQLTKFGENVGGFIDAMSKIKPEVGTGMESFCNALKTLTEINSDNAWTEFWVGKNDTMSNFGENVKKFAEGIKEAAASLRELTDDDVKNIQRAAEAGEALAELNACIPKTGGLWQSIAGSQDLADWGKKISSFADSLIAYSIKVSGKNIDADAIKKSTEAATLISDLNNAIPKSGGVWQSIAGSQDLATWGSKISAFATSLVNYSAKVSGQNIDKDAIARSAEAATEIAKLNDAIPESDGVWQWLTGEKDLSTFGYGLGRLADGLLNYARKAAEINTIGIEPIKQTGAAIDEIRKVVEKVPEIGGLFGVYDPGAFGSGVRTLADGIGTYCQVAATIDQADIDAIGFTQKAIVALEQVVSNLSTLDNSKTSALATAARNLNSFCTTINAITMSGYDFGGMNTLKTEINNFLSMVDGMSVTDVRSKFESLAKAAAWVPDCAESIASLNDKTYGGVAVLKNALEDLAGANIDGVISAFSGKAPSIKNAVGSVVSAMSKGLEGATPNVTSTAISLVDSVITAIKDKAESFTTAGKTLTSNLAKGIKSEASSASEAAKTIATKVVSGARTGYAGMKTAGSYLVDGLAAGISENSYKAAAKAKAMAEAAETAARNALKINSPSKVFKEIGSGIPEGFAMGIGLLGGSVKNTALDMANNAISTVSNSIRKISSLVESDIDAQPTIRPVLDLSDVRSGVSAMSGMLNVDSTVGVSANIGAISSMMNRRSQNGVNSDVVSAIDMLSKKMDNIGNTTYQINGITYDDGSNITDAVATLVRAAMIERRV